MDVLDEWNGRRARALQEALRMTGEAFAEKLGIAVRTVRDWHRKPEMKPRKEVQQALDTLLDQAPEAAKARFWRWVNSGEPESTSDDSKAAVAPPVQALTVAIAVVVHEGKVLLVCNRDDSGGISWQFPAGIVKPGADPSVVAVHETLAETGVHCSVRSNLGRRLHPVTGVFCEYFLCDYLTGEAENRDVVENISVTWAECERIGRFIPEDRIYPPVLRILKESHDKAS